MYHLGMERERGGRQRVRAARGPSGRRPEEAATTAAGRHAGVAAEPTSQGRERRRKPSYTQPQPAAGMSINCGIACSNVEGAECPRDLSRRTAPHRQPYSPAHLPSPRPLPPLPQGGMAPSLPSLPLLVLAPVLCWCWCWCWCWCCYMAAADGCPALPSLPCQAGFCCTAPKLLAGRGILRH